MKRILVIDDCLETRIFLKLVLELEGYIPLLAENGLEGIESAVNENPDLILCDFYLPDKNGLNIYKELASNEATKLIPFIFLSGENLEEYSENIHQIQKPFTIDLFLSMIKSNLN